MGTKMTMHYLGEQRYVGLNERGQQLLIDASPVSVGVRPMEALLGALATCSAYDVVGILAKRKTPLSSYRIEVEGERAEEHPRRYTTITVRHIAGGEGVTLEALQKAVQLSHDKYCSVVASLNAEIHTDVQLEQAGVPV
ncbi:OsmC family protein [Deinococcus peraridilitoris]|uniref:Putative redox protein, regulator of disulfide bond formation n=1 Tax=Deinococcus peraridilitoris (strain DSM 19664 / LMG 22246 / CIP 109416 / KR-200) TaxID=937777 RepID=K9ZW89_DEIPD|nr:OsmC family protein [Deinococcus peraridilitoris]AFZ65836.1 putative redox protein, regulator of disulfide bond formation [Deinococcus peraridilitoris DSM 19664]